MNADPWRSKLLRRCWEALETAHLGGLLSLLIRESFKLGWWDTIRFNRLRWHAWSGARKSRKTYCLMSADTLRSRRKSDTAFVFGSGNSLTEITNQEWERISEHDTIGLNWFIHQSWIKVDYHFIRELENRGDRFSTEDWINVTSEFAATIERNPLFEDTVLFLQEDFLGIVGNLLMGHQLIRPGRKIFQYRTYRGRHLPTRSFDEGIPRTAGAMGAGVNLAFLAGWKQIVLVGVDLYDFRYFWLPEGKSRTDRPVDATHPAAGRGIVQDMGDWRNFLSSQGVDLTVYNEKSLLTEVMPVYSGKAGPI